MIKIGDKVSPLRGKHKGEVFTVEMIATGTLGEIHTSNYRLIGADFHKILYTEHRFLYQLSTRF